MHLHFAPTFGFENVFPNLVQEKDTYLLGQQYIGSKGLLEYLELHLGIPARDYGTVLRIQKYQAAVEKALAQHPDLYCNASFQIDPWNTAKELMQWRDHLQLNFWKFNCTDPTLHRLYTLSCIEPHTGGVPKGIYERWIAAYQELATSPSALPLKEITVYEAPDQLHPFFGKLLERLRQNGIAVHHHQPLHPQPQPPTTDLQLFQKRLQSSGQQPKATAKGDGSLTILKASNDFLLADGLAAYLSQAKTNQIHYSSSKAGAVCWKTPSSNTDFHPWVIPKNWNTAPTTNWPNS